MLTLTCDQVRRIDQLAVEHYAMPSILLMENAGRNAAQIIQTEFDHLAHPGAAIVCGPGNNGGDGFVIARHLYNAGWATTVLLTVPAEKLKGDALTNFQIISKTSIPIQTIDTLDQALAQADLIIDALLGTGFTGQPRPPMDSVIRKINQTNKPVVAVDVPSGLDCFTGIPGDPTIRAHLTVSFVAVKTAFLSPSATPYLGKLQVADIGVPKDIFHRVKNQT